MVDPAWLLYLAEWDSREAFEAYRQTSPMPGTPDQFAQLPACRFYRRLALFERVLVPVSIIWVDVVDGPAERHAARRDLALAHHRSSVRGRPDLVLLEVYEAVDAGAGLLIVSGWESIASLQPTDQEPERELLERLAASGATVQRFVGRPLAETPAS